MVPSYAKCQKAAWPCGESRLAAVIDSQGPDSAGAGSLMCGRDLILASRRNRTLKIKGHGEGAFIFNFARDCFTQVSTLLAVAGPRSYPFRSNRGTSAPTS
jgi:hypothetical protein